MKTNLLKFAWILLIFSILTNIQTFSQTKLDSNKKQVAPYLKISEGRKGYNLKVSKVEINVSVIGSLAITNIDITFQNDIPRVLEGELVFPLGENQTVSRLAMEINGKLREAVPVEKSKGRKVFEEIVRRGVDPALLEQTEGNMYRARIYPIPASGTKRIILGYEETLNATEDGLVYRLPLNYKDTLDKFTLIADVLSSAISPVIDHKTAFQDVDFGKSGNTFSLKTEYNDYKADQTFEFYIPNTENSQNVMIDIDKNQNYFAVNLNPKFTKIDKPRPNKVCLVWDASNSMRQRDIEKEEDLLKYYFEKYKEIDLQVIVFSNVIDKKKNFKIRKGDITDLIKFLSEVKYDGATQYGILDLNEYNCDEFLLFTDGMSNFGDKEIKLSNKAIYSINSLQNANHSYLQYISQITGGQYVNLLNLEEGEANQLLTSLPLCFISAEYNKSDINETYPSKKMPIGSNFLFTGKMNSNSASIKLNFGTGNTITHSEIVNLKLDANNVKNGIISRLWAKTKLVELDLNYEKNKNEISEIGKEFCIVTKNTSLIILETIQDYLKYKIKPPDDMLDEYNNRLTKDEEDKLNKEKIHNNLVVGFINNYTKWWNTDFSKVDTNRKVDLKNTTSPNPRTQSANNSNTFINDSLMNTMGNRAGSIYCKVKDVDGKPLIGASVQVRGTVRGAIVKEATGVLINRIPLGVYNIRVSFIGKKTKEFANVRIDSGRTVELEAILENETTQLREVALMSDRIVDQTSVGVRAEIGEVNDNSETPINDPLVPQTRSQSSLEGFVVRGSRASETSVRVDGIEIGNGFTGGNGSADEGQTRSGSFRAEHGDTNRNSNLKSKISVQTYSDSSKYFIELEKSGANEFYPIYLKWKEEYFISPFYYIDAAEIAIRKGLKDEALKIISNLAEIDYENSVFLRILAIRLRQMKFLDESITVYREVLKNRDEEPQSYRDLALTLADNKQFQEAADMLYKVITSTWDNRFHEIEMIAINELNNVIEKSNGKIDLSKYDSKYLLKMPVDLRIVLNWDADNTDIDLWVKDPNGEDCYFSHNRTKSGGKISRDITAGYGPEEFEIKNALEGNYEIKGHYYGSRSQKIFGPVTVYLEVYTNYGKPNEKKEIITTRLDGKKDWIELGSIEFVK